MRSLCVGVVVCAVAIAVCAAEVPEKVRQNIKVINSSDAKGKLDTEKLQLCFWQLLEQQGLAERQPPRILIFHVSKAEAAVASVHDNIVRVETVEVPARIYYQVWLIDEFKPAHYLVAFQAIIRSAFNISVTQERENGVLLRALRTQEATIRAIQH